MSRSHTRQAKLHRKRMLARKYANQRRAAARHRANTKGT